MAQLPGRNLGAYRQLCAQLAATDMAVPFLDKPPRLIGAGSYNDVFLVRFKANAMVLRLSYYSPYTLSKVQALIRQRLPHKQLLAKAHKVTAQDPVSVKNNYSAFCNMLIERDVCPHFVYMYHQKDVKCFAALVKDQVKPERQRNNLSFRYNNVSFHEKFQTSLRLRLRQLTDAQLAAAVFQVVYALAMMQHYLPDFRHNDLSLDNVLITTYAPTPGRHFHYKVGEASYWLPDVGVFLAVTDFDLAHAPVCVVPTGDGKGKPYGLRNQLIAKDQFGNHGDAQARNINGTVNRSFDTYYFLYRLREALGSRHQGSVARWLAAHDVLAADKTKYIAKAYPTLYPAVMLANAAVFQPFRAKPATPSKAAATYQPAPLPAELRTSAAACATSSSSSMKKDATQPPRKVTMQSVVLGH
ncbi:hypothetical protein COO60DRAFT_1646863 [Scenedesmus sp. NREL 46B-D3]|nr:hypothetical protein COO60DRAFT_1646863 [Scenedesmus sp. NREL 46B-D3]